MLALLAASALAQSIPNGDFEGGTLAGWSVVVGPAGALDLYASVQEPVWTMEVDRGSGRAEVCSAPFVVTRDLVTAQMVNIDGEDGESDWWVEAGGIPFPAETEQPDDAGDGWSDHSLGVGAACGQQVVLCVEPERYELITYDDFVLAGAPCPGYTDGDGDGYCAIGTDTDADGDCTGDAEFAGPSDCDDGNPGRNPGAAEICNGIDDDCEGGVDEGFDADGDGWVCDDCDDTVPTTHPDAVEQCNGIDDDCNAAIDDGVQTTIWWPDADGDGYGDPDGSPIEGCAAEPGFVVDPTDCDDSDDTVHPGAADPTGDGIDADCDGTDGEGTLPVDTSDTGLEPEVPTDRGPAPDDPLVTGVGCGCSGGGAGAGGWLVPWLVLGLGRRTIRARGVRRLPRDPRQR